jgi:hypothetical protein
MTALAGMIGIYPSDLKMQSSAGVQIVKYKAFVLRHSCSMSNTNNAVVGNLKPARRELRQKPSAALQHLKRGCNSLHVVPCPEFLPKL